MTQIFQAQADSKNTEKAKLWRQLKQKEQARQLAAAEKRAIGASNNRQGLIQVTAPILEADKSRWMYSDKTNFEIACLNEA